MALPYNRLNFITLCVTDLARARAYYEALGWVPENVTDTIAFYRMDGQYFALFTLEGLSEETGLDVAALRTGAMTLAQNYHTEADVEAAFNRAVACGAKPVRAPFKTGWGGYSCYVADPDGHLWEFAHNPFSPLDAEGRLA